jgi:diguanylate cyclase (GGDEF)-like protein
MVIVDIDNFKVINDSQGHQAGDNVLSLVGHCLQKNLRQSDTVCRWGGDELVLLLPDLKDRSVVPAICQKLSTALQQELATMDKPIPVTLSMGYSVFPEDATDPELLMRQADHALYQAKSEGRNGWREFKEFGKGKESKGIADLYISLSEAVKNGKIQVHFQPIMDGATRQLTGVEALARWHDEVLGWVSPDQFIPMAEDRGLILPLGRQVVQIALAQLADLRGRGQELALSINLARAQLLDPDFRPWLLDETNRLNLEPDWITLEITERQSLLSHTDSQKRMDELAQAGFHLSLDDFGTGYAALEMVGEMPFTELKIPRPLILKLENPKGVLIVRAIVEMARSFGLQVVAEGVENKAMVDILQSMGTDRLQGYFFAKPLTREGLLEFMETYRPCPAPANLAMNMPRRAA